jgi:NitT/TauT family transport system permease protein
MKPTLAHPVKSLWPALAFLVLALAIAEISFRMQWIPNYLLPGPSLVFTSLIEDSEAYKKAFFETLFATLKGLTFSVFVGVLLASLFSVFSLLKRAVLPFCIFFQTVPVVALAPLMVIWFGFGEPTVIASAAIVSFFPMLANSLLGFDSVRPEFRDLFQSFRATRLQTLLKLEIPAAVPSMLSGLRISSGLAVIGAIVGEFVGGGGLGSLIDSARTQQKIEMVFAAVLLSSLLGLFLIAVVSLMELALERFKN